MSDVTLREYIDQRFSDLERRVDERVAAIDAGINKAERTMNERLNSMNEFRDALRDAQARMATRLEMDKIDEVVRDMQRSKAATTSLDKIDGAVRDLQNAKANLDGRLVMMSGGISVVVSIILWALTRVVE